MQAYFLINESGQHGPFDFEQTLELGAARLAVHKQIVVEALAVNLRPVRGPVRLTFRYVFPDERKRDIDNLTTGVTKAAIDALVRCKALAADDSGHVTEEIGRAHV